MHLGSGCKRAGQRDRGVLFCSVMLASRAKKRLKRMKQRPDLHPSGDPGMMFHIDMSTSLFTSQLVSASNSYESDRKALFSAGSYY